MIPFKGPMGHPMGPGSVYIYIYTYIPAPNMAKYIKNHQNMSKYVKNNPNMSFFSKKEKETKDTL